MNRRALLISAVSVSTFAAMMPDACAQAFLPNAIPRNARPTPYAARATSKTIAADSWFTDVPRGSFAHAKVGDEIFILGGHTGLFHCYQPQLFTDQFLAYNVKSKTWRKLPSYPFPVQSPNLVAVGSDLLCFGGYRYDHAFHYVECSFDSDGRTEQERDTYSGRSDDHIYRLDAKSEKWELYGHMPRRRSSGVAFASKEKVFLLGGWDGTPSKRKDRTGSFHASIDILDLKSGTFDSYDGLMSLPLRRALSSADMKDGTITLIGGLTNTGKSIANITTFDSATGGFRESAPLKETRFAPGGCFTGKWLVVAGGLDFNSGLLDTVAFSAPNNPIWKQNAVKLDRPSMFVELEPLDENTVLALGAFDSHNPYPLIQEIKIG